MKNKILQLFLLVIFLSAIFTACNTKSSSNSEEVSEMDIKNDELNSNVLSSDISTNEGETYVLHTTEEGVVYFEASVIKINGDRLLVKPLNKYSQAKSYNRIDVPNWFDCEVKKGDVITYYYDGLVIEIGPPLLNEIYKMTMVDEEGNLIVETED